MVVRSRIIQVAILPAPVHYYPMDKKSLETEDATKGESGVVPEQSFYEKPLKQKAIKDKTGWEVRPENKMIMSGSLAPADKGNVLIPEGFDQPSSNKSKGKS